MRRLAAIYRKPSYSPNQHRSNDTAILDATVAHLAARGWEVTCAAEGEIERGVVPEADLYLNMCQGERASEQLAQLEESGARVINRASSVLNCHRHRLVERLIGSGLAFPRTVICPASGAIPAPTFAQNGGKIWIKRGDVHAERAEDVVAVNRYGIEAALAAFAARGIARVALQEHVPGPVLKFYALADGSFFRYYDAEHGPNGSLPAVNERRLVQLVFDAARLLRLDVFGGDVVLTEPDRPVLIDLNDWPSFAPFREDAAVHIAEYLRHHADDRRSE
jgi:hypothetical protein